MSPMHPRMDASSHATTLFVLDRWNMPQVLNIRTCPHVCRHMMAQHRCYLCLGSWQKEELHAAQVLHFNHPCNMQNQDCRAQACWICANSQHLGDGQICRYKGPPWQHVSGFLLPIILILGRPRVQVPHVGWWTEGQVGGVILRQVMRWLCCSPGCPPFFLGRHLLLACLLLLHLLHLALLVHYLFHHLAAPTCAVLPPSLASSDAANAALTTLVGIAFLI